MVASALVELVQARLDGVVQLFGDLVPVVEKTVVLTVPGLNDALQPLSESIGFDMGMLKYVLAMFLAYPLAAIMSLLPKGMARHVFSAVVGLWYAQEIFGVQWIHSFISSLVTYIIVAVAPKKYIATLVFVFVMAYMSLSHLYRLYVDYLGWSLDFTGPQMILTIKLSSFAYNAYDGMVDADRLKALAQDPDKYKKKIATERLSLGITSLPNPLEFLGYVYCFTTFLAGPAFEYSEYANVMNETAFANKNDPKNSKNSKKPTSVLAALWRLLQGVVFMAIFLVGSGKLPIGDVVSKEVLSMPPLHRWAWNYASLFFVRMKYYFAWKVAEGSCVLAGFGFQGYNDKGEVTGWDGVSNMDVKGFELAGNTTEAARAWNKGTQKWLQRYVYFRCGDNLVLTYFISAFWHGFYPGYYLFFFSVAIFTNVFRLYQKKVTPRFTEGPLAPIYGAVSIACFSVFINYLSIVFQLLSWERSITIWKSYFFLGHGLMVAVGLISAVLPKPKSAEKKSA